MADVLAAPTDAAADPDARAPVRTYLPVIEGGVVTTILTLAFLYWTAHKDFDFNPMGWYANYVIPMGAIMVGVVAGSGYGIMSWLKGVRIRRGLLLTVVGLQLVAYVGAEYMSYLDLVHRATLEAEADGDTFEPAPFLSYFHHKTENFAWQQKNSSTVGEPLGHWGYFFVGLAALGFVCGGLIAPVVTMNLPYCAGCQRYMKRKTLGVMPASVPARKVKKGDTEAEAAYAAESQAAADAAETHSATLIRQAGEGDVAGFRDTTAAVFGPKRQVHKLPLRVSTDLIHCPGCGRGWLRQMLFAGQGKQIKQTEIARTEVGADFTEATLRPVSPV